MLRLDSYERHYAIPAPVAGQFSFEVNGDAPNGRECSYNSAGVLVPTQNPWPIILYALKAELKVITSGNQCVGVMVHLWARPHNHGGDLFLASGITSPFIKPVCWAGVLPNDWGFGASVFTAAGLTTTHKLVLTALYSPREEHG